MRRFGIIGKPLEHSYSRQYFAEKFRREHIRDALYENFLLQSIGELPGLLHELPDIVGLNVTHPFKVGIIACLDELDKTAEAIGAVNTISVQQGMSSFSLKGFNTDAGAFLESLKAIIPMHRTKALVLGSGGVARSVGYALRSLEIEHSFVSRNPVEPGQLAYHDLDRAKISNHHLIINATPLGMYPEMETCPLIPYEFISGDHVLYDLVYNPGETEFMKRGEMQGAKTFNGLEMFRLQAEMSWDIWNH